MRQIPHISAAIVLGFWIALATLFCSFDVRAAGDDAAVMGILNQTLADDYLAGNFNDVRSKLDDASGRCAKKGCSNSTKAQLVIVKGMVASQLGKVDEAKSAFSEALGLDSAAQLPERGVTPSIKGLWSDAKAQVAQTQAAPLGGAGPDETTVVDTGSLPPGWKSVKAFKLALEATKAQEAQNYPECIEKDKASIDLDDQPRTRLHLSACEYRAGKMKDALASANLALTSGKDRNDAALMKAARQRVEILVKKIPRVTFVPPVGVRDLAVTFDDRPVPVDALTKKFSVDPGKHVVHADGSINGFPAKFEEEVEAKEEQLSTVKITLKPIEGVVTQSQIKCMLEAKSQEDVQKCLPQERKTLVIKMGTDASSYSDTNSVFVFSPGINASFVSPTAGWNVGASYLFDVYSAASPDIVSYASPPFREQRHAATATGGYKPGIFGVQGVANISSEPDYLSLTSGVSVTADLNDKLTTPRLGVSYSHDTIGTKSVPFDVFHNYLDSFVFEAGLTQVLSSTTLLQIGGTVQTERGDQSKPYRHVPMFTEEIAKRIKAGQSIRVVDTNRLPYRPLEQLPTERDRFAVAGRFIKRMGTATLRLEERLYYDTWSSKATTTDFRYMMDLSRRLRVWPHGRFHFQTATSFYKRAYTVRNEGATVVIPTYRTGDRELSPMATLTGGGGARFGLGNLEAEAKAGLTVALDLMYSQFFDSLFVTQRLATYGTIAFDVEF